MTQNQIQYWANQETGRANRERERLTEQANNESIRHNTQVEIENQRHDLAVENISQQEASERARSNRASETYNKAYLAEQKRHASASELLEARKRDIELMQTAANVQYNNHMATVSMLNALTNRYLAQVQSSKVDVDRYVATTGRYLADAQRERNRNDLYLGTLADERERTRIANEYSLDTQRLQLDTKLGYDKLNEQYVYHKAQIGVDVARIGLDAIRHGMIGVSGMSGMSTGPYYYNGAPMLAP